MTFKTTVFSAVLAMGATSAHGASIDALDMLRSFNTIVLGDVTSSVHYEGTAYIGGNLNASGFYANSDGRADGTVGDITAGFIVGGNVSSSLNDAGQGAIVVGGNLPGPFPTTNTTVVDGVGTNVAGGVPVDAVTAAMEDLSRDLSGYADTPGASYDVSNINLKQLTSGAGGTGILEDIAILNMSGADATTYFGNGTAFFNLDPGVTTVVNVAGETININNNFNDNISNILFNFYEATSITLDRTFNMSILAPLAHVNFIGGGMNGTLVAASLNQQVEVRPYGNTHGFNGNLPVAPVPVPAAGLLLLAGLAGLGFAGRRRAA